MSNSNNRHTVNALLVAEQSVRAKLKAFGSAERLFVRNNIKFDEELVNKMSNEMHDARTELEAIRLLIESGKIDHIIAQHVRVSREQI